MKLLIRDYIAVPWFGSLSFFLEPLSVTLDALLTFAAWSSCSLSFRLCLSRENEWMPFLITSSFYWHVRPLATRSGSRELETCSLLLVEMNDNTTCCGYTFIGFVHSSWQFCFGWILLCPRRLLLGVAA